jgi:hypothetical protein
MITGTRTCAEKDTDIFFSLKLLYCRGCHPMSRIMKSGASWIPTELIDYILFYVPLKNLSLIWRNHHYRWRAVKFRPMLGAQGLRAGRDHYCATLASFFRSHPKNRPHSVASYNTQKGMWRTYSNPNSRGYPFSRLLPTQRGVEYHF